MAQQQDLDRMVHAIAARVREKLQAGAREGISTTSPCNADKEHCVG